MSPRSIPASHRGTQVAEENRAAHEAAILAREPALRPAEPAGAPRGPASVPPVSRSKPGSPPTAGPRAEAQGPLMNEATALPAYSVASIVDRPPGHFACLACGIAVPHAVEDRASAANVIRVEVEALNPARMRGRYPRTTDVLFTRCETCAALHERAKAIVAAHPRMSARQGSPSVAVHRVEAALCALSVLLRPLPPPDLSDAELASLLFHLPGPGTWARWLVRFTPILAEGALPATCTPQPWAHVAAEVRQACLTGLAATLAERVARNAPPVALPPPSMDPDHGPRDTLCVPGGCLMCGVGAEALPALAVLRAGGRAQAALDVWTRRVVTVNSLGGSRSLMSVVGHLCRGCASAADRVGAMGPSALQLALVHHLGADLAARIQPGDQLLRGLRGWGALVAEAHRRGMQPPLPSPKRWAHVAAPDELAAGLRTELGVS